MGPTCTREDVDFLVVTNGLLQEKWITHFAFSLAGGWQMVGQTAASLQRNWCRLRQILADEVAMGGAHKDGWSILELFIDGIRDFGRGILPCTNKIKCDLEK